MSVATAETGLVDIASKCSVAGRRVLAAAFAAVRPMVARTSAPTAAAMTFICLRRRRHHRLLAPMRRCS